MLKVQLPDNLVGRGQNCTVKCNPVYESPTYVNVAVHEKYNEVFCSDCPDISMPEYMVSKNWLCHTKIFCFWKYLSWYFIKFLE